MIESNREILEVVGVVTIVIVILVVVFTLGFRTGYKACASDFYEGKVQVELIELPNGERKWEWIDND